MVAEGRRDPSMGVDGPGTEFQEDRDRSSTEGERCWSYMSVNENSWARVKGCEARSIFSVVGEGKLWNAVKWGKKKKKEGIHFRSPLDGAYIRNPKEVR